jgi:hypothetical protein
VLILRRRSSSIFFGVYETFFRFPSTFFIAYRHHHNRSYLYLIAIFTPSNCCLYLIQ